MSNKYEWEVVIEEMGRRIVVADFSTEQGRFTKDTEKVFAEKFKRYDSIYKEAEDIYIREKGKSIYRIAVELNGIKDYSGVPDEIPIEVIYKHIQQVREVHRCYNIPATIWLEKSVFGEWVEYF